MTTKTTLIEASRRFGLALFATGAALSAFAMAQTIPGVVEDDVVLQVSGTGPSERRFINPPGNPE